MVPRLTMHVRIQILLGTCNSPTASLRVTSRAIAKKPEMEATMASTVDRSCVCAHMGVNSKHANLNVPTHIAPGLPNT